jgi:hypothetical protein
VTRPASFRLQGPASAMMQPRALNRSMNGGGNDNLNLTIGVSVIDSRPRSYADNRRPGHAEWLTVVGMKPSTRSRSQDDTDWC